MERENRSNGNQEESKEGRKEETLRAFNQSKTVGTLKASPKFLRASSGYWISCPRKLHTDASRWQGRGCGRRKKCSRSRAWRQIPGRQSFGRLLPLRVCTPAIGFRYVV